MTKKLISMGHNVNHKKIGRIMRENGLNSVVRRRKYRPEVYERRKLLTDQGSSYTSYDYRDYLLSLGVKQSCSDVGECWDNAAMESFNAI